MVGEKEVIKGQGQDGDQAQATHNTEIDSRLNLTSPAAVLKPVCKLWIKSITYP